MTQPKDENFNEISVETDGKRQFAAPSGENESASGAANGTQLTHGRSRRVREYEASSFTYFVRDGDAIKIGTSVHPEKRIKSLQTGISRPLETLAIVSMDIADEIETHEKFAHIRISGEWFRSEPELLQFIAEVKSKHDGLPPPAYPKRRHPAPSLMDKRRAAARSNLKKLAMAHGADSHVGRICHNLLEQTAAMATYVRPAWATHEMQTLPWMIQQQMKLLARAVSQAH